MTYSVWGSFGSNVATRDVFATETFAILRALTPPPSTLNTSIEVDGGVAKGDGLGGIFYYDSTSVLADDNVNVIAPTPIPAAGRWRRLLINVGFAVVTGGVVFGAGNVLAQDTANFFWDNVNKRLGIGNAAPTTTLDVTGVGKFSGNLTCTGTVISIANVTPSLFLIDSVFGTTNFQAGVNSGGTGVGNFAMWNVPAGKSFTFAVNNVSKANLDSTGVFTVATSVVTPLVDATGALLLRSGGAGALQLSSAIGVVSCNSDNTTTLGTAALRWSSLFTPILDSGTTGSLSLKTNNGTSQATFGHTTGIDLLSATVRFPGIGTTAVAANATLNAVGSNDLLRSTSSQRYKKDWRNLEDADLSILNNIRTIKYKSLSEQDDPDLIHYGMLAEDVFKLNKNLVTFNTIDVGFDLDVPDWVQYERFIPLLIEQRRRDVKRIEALEAKLGIH